jgi:subtilisin
MSNEANGASPGKEETTGQYVIVFADEVANDVSAIKASLRSSTGVRDVATTSDFAASNLDVGEAGRAEATVFAELGVAVVNADPARMGTAVATADARILAVEPERIHRAIAETSTKELEYLRGYRDAVDHLYGAMAGNGATTVDAPATLAGFVDTDEFTWGLQATGVSTCSLTGQGVRLAVLDTGFDLGHPDFAGRSVTAESFVPRERPQDGHGHGTHCIGTACGAARPQGTRRYGVASAAEIFAGKVLSDRGSGTDTGILAGISWAIANRCAVISMSLGADVRKVSIAYNTVGRRALARGSLIVAAAGNNASRSAGDPGFVGMPANSPSIMAVGAVAAQMGIADFSAQANPVNGGQVDIAGPGVEVFSSWPGRDRYKVLQGTSMATPHVSGVAALWVQSTGARGQALWDALVRAARPIGLPAADGGAGLVQAPQG